MTKRSSRAACAERAFGVEEVEVFFFFFPRRGRESHNSSAGHQGIKQLSTLFLLSLSLFLSMMRSIFALVLSRQVPGEVAIALSVISRLLLIVVELVFVSLAAAWGRGAGRV